MSRLLTHWNSIPGKPGFKTIGGQSIFGSGDIAVSDSSKVPYTGATQGLNMGLYDIQATRFQFGSTGPRLDAAVDGTVRVRTNDGLADAPLSASNLTLSGNQIIGNPSGLGPSPYLSAVNSFSEATLELRNSLTNGYTNLNLGSLVASGTGNFGGNLTTGGNLIVPSTFLIGSQSSPGVLRNGIRHLGSDWVDVVAFGNTRARFRHGNTLQLAPNFIDWMSSTDFPNATVLGSIGPNSTAIETRAAGGLKVCNADGSALAAVACSNITVGDNFGSSGRVTTGVGLDWGLGFGNRGTLGAFADGIFGFRTLATTAGFLIDCTTDGTAKLRNRSNTADGSLNLANLTASGNVIAGPGTEVSPSIKFTGTNTGIYQAAASVGLSTNGTAALLAFSNLVRVPNNSLIGWASGSAHSTNITTNLSQVSAGLLQLGTTSANALGSLNLANLTASGIVTATSGFQTHTTNTGFKSTTNGIYCMLDATNGWTLQRQGSNGVIKACNIQETAGVCLDVSTDDTLTIKSRANAVNARLSVPGSFHTVTIGPADSTFGANMTAGNQLLFHSTVYGAKAAIGFNNAGAFQINNVLLGPSSVFNQLTALLGYSYAPAFCTDATSSQEKGMFSSAGVLYLTVNRGNQLAVDGTGVSIAGLLTASGVITSGFRSLSADPTILDITAGLSQLVKNTTSGEIRLWVNDGGTMKKSAALT